MKWSLIVLFCLLAVQSRTQERLRGRRPLSPAAAAGITTASPAQLAAELTTGDSTDLQKVHSIMQWIADHIVYNLRQDAGSRYAYTPPAEDTGSLKPLNDRVAEMVLQRGRAVCEGYARLFASLCSYAGIHSELVRGYAKTNMGHTGKLFRTNHTWNAVRIDSSWYLLDATWASGYVNYRNEFESHYDPSYFLTPPRVFALDHYPEELRWALLPEPPVMREFERIPFRTAAFLQAHIRSFYPAAGTLTASPGDTLHFGLETADTSYAPLRVTDQVWLHPDSLALPADDSSAAVHPASTAPATAAYIVPPGNHTGWLNLVYKDAVVLRYRLKIVPRPAAP
jgi:hypothetical protein